MTPVSTTVLSNTGLSTTRRTAAAGVEPALRVAAASVALRRVGPGAYAVAETVLELLRALAGFGDLGQSLIRLTGFGATSGSHVIEGVRRVVAALPPAGQP